MTVGLIVPIDSSAHPSIDWPQSMRRQRTGSTIPTIPVKRTISIRAVLQRLQRVLPKEQKLLRARPAIVAGKRIYPRDVGRFYIINVSDKTIAEHHIDLEAFGRRYHVIQPWEVLEAPPKVQTT